MGPVVDVACFFTEKTMRPIQDLVVVVVVVMAAG